MTNYIQQLLVCLDLNNYLGKKHDYFKAVTYFFQGADPTDLDYFATRNWDNPYAGVLNKTLELSGINDARTDGQGRDFSVETTHLWD